MHPLLFNIGSLPVHTYGFLVALGFLAAVFTVRTLAIRAKLDVEKTLDMVFWLLLMGLLGARILFIITKLDYFLAEPGAIFRVWEGGLVFLGGVLLAAPFGIWYTYRNHLPAWKTADVLMPGLTINHMFGRFGCLAAGCCYGKPTGTGFGVRLDSDLVDPAYRGILLHPTQLYEAGGLLVLFLGLLWVQKHKSFDGQTALTYFIAYPIIRSIVEVYRGDLIRGFVIDKVLSTSQFISIVILVIAAGFLQYRLKQVRAA